MTLGGSDSNGPPPDRRQRIDPSLDDFFLDLERSRQRRFKRAIVVLAGLLILGALGIWLAGCSFSGHLGCVDPPEPLVRPMRYEPDPVFQYSIPRDQR